MFVSLELVNLADMQMRAYASGPGEIRRASVSAFVDEMAVRLILPRHVAEQLGLMPLDRDSEAFRDRRDVLPLYGYVQLELLGRRGTYSVAVSDLAEDAVVGGIVFADLDLIVDHASGLVLPRDPRYIISEC